MPPQANLLLAQGHPKLATPAPTPPTRALNAPVQRGRLGQKRIPATPALGHRLRIISQRCFANPPCEAIPRHCTGLCSKASVNSVTLCRPLRYGLHVAPLERGRRNPRKWYVSLPRARAGRCRDVRPVEHVSSINSGPARPSPPLCHHPGHCNTIPGVVGARGYKTSPRPLLCDLQPSVSPTLELTRERRPNKRLPHHYPRGRSWRGTGLAATSLQKQDSLGQPSTSRRCTPYRHM
jgi:hypothetical protein